MPDINEERVIPTLDGDFVGILIRMPINKPWKAGRLDPASQRTE